MKLRCLLLPFLLSLTVLLPSRGAGDSPVVGEEPFLEPVSKVFSCREGPWGKLEYYYTFLEAPDSIMDPVPIPSSETFWYLPAETRDEQRKILETAGVLPAQVDAVFANSNPPGDGSILYPPPEVIADLPRDVRGMVYRQLRAFPENARHRTPLVMETRDVRQWFAGGRLPEETLDLIERLSYPLGSSLAFSDIPFVLHQNTAVEQAERDLLRAMTRTRSLILRLRIDQDSDLLQLKDYWTAGFKNKDVLPLLDSVSRIPGLDHIDIIHLLPPVPRQYLNTFPSLAEGLDGSYPDSFWAALNFSEYLPRNEFKDLKQVARYAEFAYEPAENPLRYGDLLVVYNSSDDVALQAAVYVADDIVYTKNGRSVFRPFLLTRLPDLVSRFQGEIPFEVRAWRKRSRE